MDLTEADIYTAGLFDGEGSVSFMRTHRNRNRCPVVSLPSTSKELIEWLVENYGGSICRQKKYADHHKDGWRWKLTYNRALGFLRRVSPYLKERSKLRRAQMLLTEYPDLVSSNGRYTTDQRDKIQDFTRRFFSI